MLLRLAYLGITNGFALLRLLPGSGRDEDVEILALRHQLAVLQRQIDGHRVRFDPATCMRFFAGPRLLVIDELGYLPLSGDGAAALFQVINQRYLKSSTILSTNVGIADWATAFGDATVAAAMLDRLLHRGTVVGSTGHRIAFGPTRTTPAPCARRWPLVPAETPEPRRCPICGSPIAGAGRYCSPACKTTGCARPTQDGPPVRHGASPPNHQPPAPCPPHCARALTAANPSPSSRC